MLESYWVRIESEWEENLDYLIVIRSGVFVVLFLSMKTYKRTFKLSQANFWFGMINTIGGAQLWSMERRAGEGKRKKNPT